MQYGIASFRSRQQVLAFESVLKRAGIRAQVVSTPREVALGCGLSVRFDLADAVRVVDLYQRAQLTNLIGFYRMDESGGGRSRPMPLFG